jgi:poly-gamma-glutamate capsule biosynthesis protein CapA/YwtB (metallophosphatase superfamily)
LFSASAARRVKEQSAARSQALEQSSLMYRRSQTGHFALLDVRAGRCDRRAAWDGREL